MSVLRKRVVMRAFRRRFYWALAVAMLLVSGRNNTFAADKPLKVFILAGQSNMQGHASISTFDSMADDPKTAELLKEMRDSDGNPVVCEKVWITSVGCLGDAYSDLTERTGKLTAGFGAPDNKIGPEFTFGITAQKLLDEPILIIKTAWGGRSLHTDFRPPSAGPYVWSDYELAQNKERGHDLEKMKSEKLRDTGVYYREMIKHVKYVLGDIKRVMPDYDPEQGYELAGFVWFQGFNDYVSFWTYDKHMEPGGYDLYGDLLVHLIRDVRNDLSAPKLPVVIGVMGIGGEKEGSQPPQMHFRQAQLKPTTIEEFKGNVVVVQTSAFWDNDFDMLAQRMDRLNDKLEQEFRKDPNVTEEAKEVARNAAYKKEFKPEEYKRLRAGVSNGGYHYLGAAKILAPIGKAFAEAAVGLIEDKNQAAAPRQPVPTEMAGYLIVPHERVDKKFNGGFSLYVAAWPMLKNYPGQDFQSGLFGTWMFSQFDGEAPKDHYSDIEGGLGWWRDTRFATETPKFIMGGVALNFSEWANGPGAGKGRDWDNPTGLYAIAQLSPWVLWPPDGLNLKQGTSGELFGYGYLPLPLTQAKKTTAGKNVPTGNHCWTLFLNTGNFKGPVTFFTPYFWSRASAENPKQSGLFLDTRPSEPNKALQMETQYVPAFVSTDAQGNSYARIAPTQFPGTVDGQTPLVHRITAYEKAALWDDVQAWFDGGTAATGEINTKFSDVHVFKAGGYATWEIKSLEDEKKKVPVGWSTFAKPSKLNDFTYSYIWASNSVTQSNALITLPEYFRLEKNANNEEQWSVVSEQNVPAETGLSSVEFPRAPKTPQEPYVTPDAPKSSWKKPGPVAGPFRSKLGDGSVVTYFWYRFADQPALLNADLTNAERDELQKRVELLHKNWTKDRDYLPPPTVGTLADLDPALLVTPPAGLEVGYVPIVTRQEAGE